MGKSQSKSVQFIPDLYETYEQVQNALLKAGLEGNSSLIFGIDLTQSNEYTGRYSFSGKCLHNTESLNPYQDVISIIEKTLSAFDDDNKIPLFGFGDKETRDKKVLLFGNGPQDGVEGCLNAYNSIIPRIVLSGPTSFGPVIYKALELIKQNWKYHILVIIADGQITDPTRNTDDAIRLASRFPLSIIVVGVGDGPWKQMEHYDDHLKGRKFDNFQFVEFNKTKFGATPELNFAINALQEVPTQYQIIKKKKLLKCPKKIPEIPKIETVIYDSDLPPAYNPNFKYSIKS